MTSFLRVLMAAEALTFLIGAGYILGFECSAFTSRRLLGTLGLLLGMWF
jgi:hypothetical protein